jgi:hypothetical protein
VDEGCVEVCGYHRRVCVMVADLLDFVVLWLVNWMDGRTYTTDGRTPVWTEIVVNGAHDWESTQKREDDEAWMKTHLFFFVRVLLTHTAAAEIGALIITVTQ